MIDVRCPRRVWPGTTPIADTPATGSVPPGTVSSRARIAPVATSSPPSRTPTMRRGSVTRWSISIVLGMGDLVEGEMAGRLEGVLVGGGQPLGLAHAAALRCRQTRNATSASTPATAAAGPAVEITCSAKWPRK